MPFLFERIDDETELVLPDSLLHSDSIDPQAGQRASTRRTGRRSRSSAGSTRSYISERYEAVIGKVVASEDIPAATQRFTPKWIVRYLVQNTLGRLWLATYPQSPLRQQMKYYIEPAEQTPEVQEQLRAITPTSLNPEEITFLDPACGSAHILVEAYDLFKAIYQERGYRAKDIPRLILRQEPVRPGDRRPGRPACGVRPDDEGPCRRPPHLRRREDAAARPGRSGDEGAWTPRTSRRYLNEPVLKETCRLRTSFSTTRGRRCSAKANMSVGRRSRPGGHGRPDRLVRGRQDVRLAYPGAADAGGESYRTSSRAGDGSWQSTARDSPAVTAADFLRFLKQADLLCRQLRLRRGKSSLHGCKVFHRAAKGFVADKYKEAKADLYACFIQRNVAFTKPNGFVGMITIPNWMFLSSFEDVRRTLFDNQTIDTFIHNGRGVFGSDFGSCSFVFRNHSLPYLSWTVPQTVYRTRKRCQQRGARTALPHSNRPTHPAFTVHSTTWSADCVLAIGYVSWAFLSVSTDGVCGRCPARAANE